MLSLYGNNGNAHGASASLVMLSLSCLYLTAVVAMPKASLIGPVDRREIMLQARELAQTHYRLVYSTSPGCPQSVSHGIVTERPDDEGAIEGIFTFDQVHINGAKCPYVNTDHELRLYSYTDLIERKGAIGSYLNLTWHAWNTISMAGIDFALRKCGTYHASFMAGYYFIKDLHEMRKSLTENGFIDENVIASNQLVGERNWMLSFPQEPREPLRMCLFLEQNAFIKETPSPAAATTPGPEVDDEEEAEDIDDAALPTDDIATGSQDTTFGQANDEGLAQQSDENGDDEAACFPADATVRLSTGECKRMSDLSVGDRVQTGSDSFSPIFLFTHRESLSYHTFLHLRTSGKNELLVSPTHYIHLADGKTTPARLAVIGDELLLADGSTDRIVSITRSLRRGLYNPQTLQGNILVDNVLVSTYTEAIQPGIAHALLTPLRAVFQYCGLSLNGLESGAPSFAKPLLG